ncbi:MAG: AAA family ATPase, partial [Anaerolineales bacterium]
MNVTKKITDDLDALLGILPPKISKRITEVNDSANLLEVILDLGRLPTARFLKGEIVVGEQEITREEIDFVVA